MLTLIVDTAGTEGGVLLARTNVAALQSGKADVLGIHPLEPRKFSQQLISATGHLLRGRDLSINDVDVFGVISGPGSFTGLRVGISAVKAMAEVTQKPIVALSRLAVLASASEMSGLQKSTAEPIHSILDAGRGEFYHGIYRDGGRIRVAELLESFSALQKSVESTPGKTVVAEPIVLETLKAVFDPPPVLVPSLSVREALPLAISASHAKLFTSVVELDANYLRRMVPKIN